MNEETLFGIKFFLNVKSGKVNGPSPERALITKTKIFQETDILFLQKKLRSIMLFFSYSPIFNFEPISNYKIFSKIKKNIFSKKYLYNIYLYKKFPSKIFFVCQQKQNQIDKPSMVNFIKDVTGSNNLQKITSILEKISIFKIIFNYILLNIFTFKNYYKTNTLLNETEEIFKVFNNLKELKEEREILEKKLKQLQK